MTAATVKPRILVVDDNQDAAETLGILLETAGYEVETCFDGKSALQAAARFEPDACVLDINMPGMDGYQLAQKLREKNPEHAPVLATVTAYEDYGHMEKAVDAGFDLHFTKPADYREVAEQIGDCVRKNTKERAVVHSAEELLTDLDVGEKEIDEGKHKEAEYADPKACGDRHNWLAIAGFGLVIVVVVFLGLRMI